MRSPRPSGTVARVRGPTDPEFDAEIEAVTQVGRWEWEIDAGEARWSDQQFRIFGLEPRSVTPSLEAFVERIHGDDRARFEGVLDSALANGSGLQLMHRIVRPGGEIRTVLSRAQVGRDAAGVLRRITGATIDVTDRRRERARLREREERLAETERRLGVGSLVGDPLADRVEVSAGRHHLLGAEEGSLDGPLAVLLERVPHEVRVEWRLAFERVAGGEAHAGSEARVERRERTPLWLGLRLESADPLAVPPRAVRGAFQDISGRKLAEAEVERQLGAARARAVRDPLTGLANRTLALDRIGHALAGGRRRGADLAVLFVDLDGFKRVNDEYGHDEGDLLLKEISQRLRSNVRGSDSVARYGGDEFLVLVEEAPGRDQVMGAAGRILAAFEEPFRVGENIHEVKPSIGVTMAGRRPTSPEQLIREADAAMYEAKAAGGGTFRFAGPRSAAS